MYRYGIDDAITYTSEDFVLFTESPFASWMERLTLENPDHGIAPDRGSSAPCNSMEDQQDFFRKLQAEGKDVALIQWKFDEVQRRSATYEAMREGVDYIVNGQLAVGPVAGSANVLMRISGYSELGNYLYIPAATQGKTNFHSAFRLCFIADLLHSIQGQLPPQMLIVRGDGDVLPLNTDDHIYHFSAVKRRFMDTMSNFRKHRMPDPSESSHFGRWADCAHDILRQRALGEIEESGDPTAAAQERKEVRSEPPVAAAYASVGAASGYDMDDVPGFRRGGAQDQHIHLEVSAGLSAGPGEAGSQQREMTSARHSDSRSIPPTQSSSGDAMGSPGADDRASRGTAVPSMRLGTSAGIPEIESAQAGHEEAKPERSIGEPSQWSSRRGDAVSSQIPPTHLETTMETSMATDVYTEHSDTTAQLTQRAVPEPTLRNTAEMLRLAQTIADRGALLDKGAAEPDAPNALDVSVGGEAKALDLLDDAEKLLAASKAPPFKKPERRHKEISSSLDTTDNVEVAGGFAFDDDTAADRNPQVVDGHTAFSATLNTGDGIDE